MLISDLDAIKKYNTISLEEMDSVKLLNRIDTKFILNSSQLNSLLVNLRGEYSVLETENKRILSYETIYFDTEDLKTYFDHHKGKPNRFKIRIRKYLNSKISFFEIKKKIKGRTKKSRIKISFSDDDISREKQGFIQKTIGQNINLKKTVAVFYDRITLVNNDRTERITIDLNLKFKRQGSTKHITGLVIAELKQNKINRHSKFYQLLKKLHIREFRISKYCLGMIFTGKIKYNLFKYKLLKINKILHENGNIAA